MKGVLFLMSPLLVLVTARDERCRGVGTYGRCKGHIRMWAFSHYENMCVLFTYSGCGGTDNRFHSKAECERTCSE